MMINRGTAILIIFFLSACQSTKIGTSKINIEGNWRWIEKSGGFAGKTTTPESTGKQLYLQISKDSLFYYDSGELTAALPYQLERGQSALFKKEQWLLQGSAHQIIVEKKDSSLILTEDCYDCFTHKYVRIKDR